MPSYPSCSLYALCPLSWPACSDHTMTGTPILTAGLVSNADMEEIGGQSICVFHTQLAGSTILCSCLISECSCGQLQCRLESKICHWEQHNCFWHDIDQAPSRDSSTQTGAAAVVKVLLRSHAKKSLRAAPLLCCHSFNNQGQLHLDMIFSDRLFATPAIGASSELQQAMSGRNR